VSEQPTIIGLGEVLWDVFPDGKHPGGAPANFSFHANQLGARGLPASRIGRDALGDELVALLEGKGLETSLIQRDAQHPTGRVTVTLEGGQPSYIIHEDVAWDFLECDEVWKSEMRRAAAICFGTLAQRSQKSRAAIHDSLAAASQETLIVYDVNLRQNFYDREWVERSLHSAKVVKLNDDELLTLTRLLEIEAASDEEAPGIFTRALIDRFGVDMVCITRGAKGCLLQNANETVDVPGQSVQVADTVGAGDSFTAALIVSLLKGWSLERAGKFANRYGGLVASRTGGMPTINIDPNS